MVEVFSATAHQHHQRILIAPQIAVLTNKEATVTASTHTLLLQTLVPLPQEYLQPQPQQQATDASEDSEDGSGSAPLDLSCKGPFQPPPIHPRTSSTSSTTSSCASFASASSYSSESDGRRAKRKEQNKAAAQSYRQRKKSFSDQVEAEVDQLTERNVRLKAQKCKLEEQIRRMRSLLEETVKREASAAAWKSEIDEIDDDAMSEPMHSPPVSFDGSEEVEMRSRKYTWPLTSVNGKDRKKEQNKLASRRFRQRRKQEQTHSELEATRLETDNKRLREKCEELETRITLMKDLMSRSNASATVVKQQS